jgi:uncharacterized membrane protein
MPDSYKYVQHKRVAERAEQGPPTVRKVAKKLADGSPVTRFNRKVGLGITTSVGTMWCAYAFTLLALISLWPALSSGNLIIIVAWFAQTFLQLVLLPVIIVGQNIQAAASDARAAATYEDAGAILEEAKEIQSHLKAQDAAISALLDKTLALEKAVAKTAR